MFSSAMLNIISLFWGIEIEFIINLCISDLFDSIKGPKLDLLFVANVVFSRPHPFSVLVLMLISH